MNKRTSWKSKESCKIGTSNGPITTTREATVNVRDLDMFMTFRLLEDSFAVLQVEK